LGDLGGHPPRADLAFRIVETAPCSDCAEVRYQPRSGQAKDVYVGEVILTSGDIETIKAVMGQDGGIDLNFSPQSQTRIERLSNHYIGHQVAIVTSHEAFFVATIGGTFGKSMRIDNQTDQERIDTFSQLIRPERKNDASR